MVSENIKQIKYFPSNLVIIWDDGYTQINYDGQQGQYSREEWRQQLQASVEDGGYNITNEDDILEILGALSMTSNIDFFKEED